MKYILILIFIFNSLNAEYRYTNIKKKNSSSPKKYKSKSISFQGKVFNSTEYRDYTRISVRTDKNKRIVIKVKRTNLNLKDGMRITGNCYDKKARTYINCSIVRY
ncbi:hypothetical protein KO488_08360 [Poseidonibacter lekithochrous]|uniref:hypothetical protein n=1 Tax=Poseidonibacter TaxID=2321187 RepID=UPI001C07FD1F|nr:MULTISPECIES: hypothetical protein [Poseidonibacter]MBU3014767.1 hypothetical protein [Poseidonibacter lekithochrous]MDO6828065.1 hypothetical protein [Poseidonibacter sp. 1_MG-2023]